jgi:hypothetical protein
MFEIGDELPSLSKAPERLALIQNPDLIGMIRLGRASVPLDLMNFDPDDNQPSVFFLKEDKRQSILTVFNWTDKDRAHTIDPATIGLSSTGRYIVTDVLENREVPGPGMKALSFHLPPHSVRVLKIVDGNIAPVAPTVATNQPSTGNAGAALTFTAHSGDAVLTYHWDFGDGVSLEGSEVSHAYTEPGEYNVVLKAMGLSGLSGEDHFKVRISGHMRTTFDPQSITRYQPAN